MSNTLFADVPLAPRDPILGVTEAFAADTRADKVNLGVGVYYDGNGKLPLLPSVKRAEEDMAAKAAAHGYLPIDGIKALNAATQKLIFGANAKVIAEQRVITTQAIGGTGGLKLGADLLQRFLPGRTVLISDPSWENHRALFESAGFKVQNYRYYDPAGRGLDQTGLFQSLESAPDGSIVVLHACCHNPTGVDLGSEDWKRMLELCRKKRFVPFLDIAYQGFGSGIEEDAAAVRLFADSGISFLVSSSCSKNFSLYGERVGALSIVCTDRAEAERVLSQLKRVVRTNYSNPPTHGGAVVAAILDKPEWRTEWEKELAGMRDRIRAMREGLRQKLEKALPGQDFSFVTRQRGMFSYTGLSAAQVDRLREEHGIHAVASGRICIAALNDNNLDRVSNSIAAVLKQG